MPEQNQGRGRAPGGASSREQRLTNELVQGLADLAPPQRQPPRLKREEPRGGIPARRGQAEVNLQPGTGQQTAGIASPLTEGEDGVQQLQRTYHAASFFSYSNDFAIASVIRPIATLKTYDANGAEVELRFAAPQE